MGPLRNFVGKDRESNKLIRMKKPKDMKIATHGNTGNR